MRNIFNATFFILIIFSTSCYIGVYTPISSEVLTVSEKGEINGGIKFNVATTTTVQSTITYSPIKNIGLSFNNVFGIFHKSNGFALGSYTNSLIKKNGINTFADMYIGYTNHKQIIEEGRNYNIGFFYNKFFTQIGLHNRAERTEFSVQGRYSILDYNKLIHYEKNNSTTDIYDDLLMDKYFTSVELSPTFSYGLPHAKVMVGSNLVLYDNYKYFDDSNLFMGLTFNLNYLLSKKFLNDFIKNKLN